MTRTSKTGGHHGRRRYCRSSLTGGSAASLATPTASSSPRLARELLRFLDETQRRIRYLSPDLLHSNAFVQHITTDAIRYYQTVFKEEGLVLEHVHIWSDGCGPQCTFSSNRFN